MSNIIRTFIAIELDRLTRDNLDRSIKVLNMLGIRGLRTLNNKDIHITLKFLGDVCPSQITQIQQLVSEGVEGQKRFSLRLSGWGAYPNISNARTLWLGLGGDLGKVMKLQQRISTSLQTIGFKQEKRKFSPHLTLARLGVSVSKQNRIKIFNALDVIHLDTTYELEVASISLMKSQLHSNGATYERIACVTLGD